MDDRRKLPVPQISLRNEAPDAFEGIRHYGPQVVVGALAAILSQITGQDTMSRCATALRPMGFAQPRNPPESRRLEINVADAVLAQHGIKRRQVFPYQLLKVPRCFAAPLL